MVCALTGCTAAANRPLAMAACNTVRRLVPDGPSGSNALASWIWSRFGMACLRYE